MKRKILLLSIVLLFGCKKKEDAPPVQLTKVLMDTFITLSVYDSDFKEPVTVKKLEKAFDEIRSIEKIASAYNDSSQIYFISQNAYKQPVSITDEIKNIIQSALKYSMFRNGTFDITILPIVNLWDFFAEEPSVPDRSEINRKLPLVDHNNIKIKGNKIYFLRENMGIDPGGFVKGYAIDKVVSLLKKEGLDKFVINMGGDLGVYVAGDDTATIKIQHTRESAVFLGEFQMKEGSVATSGDYERFFKLDGVRYHHILNPFTGFPSKECISVTILTKEASLADAVATGVFVMGHKKGFDFINEHDNIEGVIVYREESALKSLVSDGMITKYNYIENEY